MEENNLIIYKNSNGEVVVNAIYKDETLWLSQKGMAKVFDVGVPAISKHLKNIFDENELDKKSVISKMEITAEDEAKERHIMTMQDWINATDDLLKFRKKGVLKTSGKISPEQAILKATQEYEKYRVKQDQEYISSIDKFYHKYLEENKDSK